MKKESSFFRDLLRLNGIPYRDVDAFIFDRGMGFGDSEKWWGSGGVRQLPHEGLDIFLYREKSGEVKKLAPGTRVPSAFNGEVVRVIDDLLGKSLVVKQSADLSGSPFYIFYAHVKPLQEIIPGKNVVAGEPVAEIAELSGKRPGISPHLHLSMALIEPGFEMAHISWETIGKSEEIQLLDPLDYI